jgi:hypothetical protein
VAAAWRLLDRLPPAADLRAALTYSKVNFVELLPRGGGYRLVYVLQLMESLCYAKNWHLRSSASGAASAAAAEWRLSTVKQGGVLVLLDLIPSVTGITRLLAVRVLKALLHDDSCKKELAEVIFCCIVFLVAHAC